MDRATFKAFLIDALREHLTIDIDVRTNSAYWDQDRIEVRVYFDGEEIASASDSFN